MPERTRSTNEPDREVARPDCDPGPLHEGCEGPPPPPWLHWKHCFKLYEFREYVVPRQGGVAVAREGIRIRARFEHALCPMGRKQGPIVHSQTLLPQEQVKIFEYDRYRRATSETARFSQRSSFYYFVSKVTDKLTSVKVDSGTAFSTTASATQSAGGGLDLPFVSFGGSASSSASVSLSSHLNVDSVFDTFSHVAQISSQAVETERSIVVSTFEEREALHSTARTLRNDNDCRAVTYFIRRVFEVYCLTTRLVGIEVEIAGNWIDLSAAPAAFQALVKKLLGAVLVGQTSQKRIEIALPTDGLLYEAELAHCSSCEPDRERRGELALKKLELEVELLTRENERRKARIAAGDLDPFDPVPESESVAQP
jgi:thermitase